MPFLFFLLLGLMLAATTIGPGRSPHLVFRPEQIDVALDDVRGIDQVKEDVIRSLNLFLAHKTFAAEMGGTPRRGLLFEGAPGTGKTYLAKAMAREAGVPFLFVSATSFQSMFYGATARKIRNYFKALRKTARHEGGCHRLHRRDRRHRATARWARRQRRPGRARTIRRLRCPHVGYRLRWPHRAGRILRAGGTGDGAQRVRLRGHRRGRERTARADAVVRRPNVDAEVHREDGRRHQLAVADRPSDSPREVARRQYFVDRGHKPGRRPRSGAASTRALRPAAQLRDAGQGSPPRPGRPSDGQEGPRRGPGPGRAPRRVGSRDPALHPGHDRTLDGRGARLRAAPRDHPDVLGGLGARPAHRGSGPRAAGCLHRPRTAAHRHPRSRPRDGGLARGPGAPS